MRVMIALGMFAMVGCQEYSIDSQPEAAANIQDDALESYIMAAESATSIVFNISANTPWRIDRDENAQWCTVTPSMSATSSLVSEVTVTVEDNETFSPRKATLTITAAEIEGWSKTITINQMSKGDFLITEWAEDIEAEGGVATYFIYTNKAWEYRPVTSYLSVDAEYDVAGEDVDDIVTYELRINVPANTGMARDAKFMIHTATADYEYTIHQIGMELRLADDQNTTFESAEVGTEMTFAVKANINWDAVVDESCADWLEITNIDKVANTVTVAITDANRYIVARKGLINLTSTVGVNSEVEVYQPTAFTIGGNWTNVVVRNDDNSATIALDNNIETLIFKSPMVNCYGTWTVEFDPENANLAEAHLYFILGTTGEEANDYYRSALTPHVVTNQGAGIYNNFVQKNGNFANGRWNFDGVGVNGTPTSTNPDEIMPFEDMPKIEKVTYTFAQDGMTMTIYSNGRVYSKLLAVGAAQLTQYETFINGGIYLTFRTIKAAAGTHVAHTGFPGEYVTFKKVYFTPAE